MPFRLGLGRKSRDFFPCSSFGPRLERCPLGASLSLKDRPERLAGSLPCVGQMFEMGNFRQFASPKRAELAMGRVGAQEGRKLRVATSAKGYPGLVGG
jgi:hypothetical protein